MSVEAPPRAPGTSAAGVSARNVARHGSVYVLASALQAIFAAVTLPVAARFLTPAQYGVASLSLIIALLFNVFAMSGLPTAAMRLYFDDEAGPHVARRLFGPAAVLALAFSAIAVVVLFALQEIFSLGVYWPSLLVLPVLTLPSSLGTLASNILQAQKRSTAFAVVAVMRGGVNTGLGVLAVVLFKASASIYLAGYAVGTILIASTAVCFARPAMGFPAPAMTRRAFKIGIPIISAGVGVFALAMADRFVVQVALPRADVGRYQLAYAVGGLVFSVLVAVNFAWLPQVLAAGSDDARVATIRQLGVILQAFAMVLIAGCALLAPIVLPAVLLPSYHPAELARLASVIALGAITYVPYMASSQLLLWNERTGVMGWITPTAVVVEVVAGAALVIPFGLTGVAVASGIAYVAQAGLAIHAAKRIATIDWLSSTWIVASLPGAACFVLGMVLPTGAVGDSVRVAVVALMLIGCAAVGWPRLRQSARPALALAEEPAPA